MQLNKKINKKIYIPTSLLVTAIALAFARSGDDVIGILIVYLAAILNLLMLAYVINKMLSDTDNIKKGKLKLVILIMGKFFVMLGGITLGVHFMGNRIIIAVLNYVVQIFIFILGLKSK